MEKLIRVAIVEDNIGFCKVMEDALTQSGKFQIAGSATDGESGMKLITESQADVALIDIAIPKKDGLYILEELKKTPDKKPVCIVISGINQENITKKALEAGADYYIVKPFDMPLMIRRIEEVYEFKKGTPQVRRPSVQEPEQDAETFVTNILRNIPVPNNLKGYGYLKYGILLSIDDPSILDSITKVLYPTIAEHFATTSTRVERAIRHAIETTWIKGHGENFVRLMGTNADHGSKPSNSMFIASVVELYLMNSKK